jgi:hypothetical protein
MKVGGGIASVGMAANVMAAGDKTPVNTEGAVRQPEAITIEAAKKMDPADPAILEQRKQEVVKLEATIDALKTEEQMKKKAYLELVAKYSNALSRAAHILDSQGQHKEAKKLLKANEIIKYMEQYVETAKSYAPTNVSFSEVFDKIVEAANNHLLDFSNKETGEMIQELTAIANDNSIGSVSLKNEGLYHPGAESATHEIEQAAKQVIDHKLNTNSEDENIHMFLGNFSQYGKAYLEWIRKTEEIKLAEQDLVALKQSIPAAFEIGMNQ